MAKLTDKLFSKKSAKKDSYQNDQKNAIITGKKIPFAIIEAYKNIRTSIDFLLADEEKNTFTVTSANAVEGKSTTSSNLAVAFSQLEKKVLLIDADLRRASIHKKFNIENKSGLSNVIINEAEFEDVVVKVKPYLHILTAGKLPPNPSELLGSKRFEEFLNKASEEYDYVIVDTPPLNVVTDSMLVAPLTGGVVLVVRDGYTPHYSIEKAIADIEFAGIKILGAVMNGVNAGNKKNYIYRKTGNESYGKYRYGYNKYGYKYGYNRYGYDDYDRYGYGGYGYGRYGYENNRYAYENSKYAHENEKYAQQNDKYYERKDKE